ncbi:MAG: hypothetical protein NVSMB9_00760 [Isosphaeraceae bacterium]
MTDHKPTENFERLINLGHLASGVGHHVINAFSAIVSNAELLRLDPPAPLIANPAILAETIIKSALDAATVARRLIDYTRPVTSTEPDRAAFLPHTLSLDQLVSDFLETARENQPSGVCLESHLESVPPIQGHVAQLQAMLGHLLVNAYETLSPEGGTIQLSTSVDGRGWNVLEIRDSGQGMSPAILERAVEPFFSTKPGHLGVGLSIANGIWRRHRGTLSILSQPGEGTKIKLCVEPSL